MAIHDYVISNASGAAVRQDLNDALAAIVSNNSNATAPTTTYAYQWWADTTNQVMKLRNAANTDWITLYQLDGEYTNITLEAGTNSAPSLRFVSDTNTGIYSPGADQVAITTGGTARLTVDASGRALVGTSSNDSNSKLVVQGNSSDSTTTGVIGLRYGSTRPTTTDVAIGVIRFESLSNTSSSYRYAQIVCSTDGTSSSDTDIPGRLTFETTADGASSPTERMRIGNAGGLRTGRGVIFGNLGVEPADTILIGSAVISSGAGNSTLKYNTATGLVTYDTSSRLVKEQIVDCPYGINELKQLQPRKYFRTDDQREEIGFVADEMVQVMPEFVPIGAKSVITKNEEDTQQIPLGVNYEKLTAVLTKALQEAIAKIETLEAKVAALESPAAPVAPALADEPAIVADEPAAEQS